MNPPVSAILKAWLIASKNGILAAQSARQVVIVNHRYTEVITQTTFEELYLYPSFERDDSSIFVSFRRYGLADGMTIRRKTTPPRPPISRVDERQNIRLRGRLSISLRMVEPVVV